MDDLIQSQAERILEQKPDPGVRYRLLKDVIHLPSEDYELSRAKMELSRSWWVREWAAELCADLETALLKWLWQRPDGIGYQSVPLGYPPPRQKSGAFDQWLVSIEMLSWLFSNWFHFAQPWIGWIWDQRRKDGY